MSEIELPIIAEKHTGSISFGRWHRVLGEDASVLRELRARYGAELDEVATAVSPRKEGVFTYIPLKFIERAGVNYQETRITIAVSDQVVISVEPTSTCPALDLASSRMSRDGHDDDTSFEILASILRAVSDVTDRLVSDLDSITEKVMIQTNSILRSLETKETHDFGVSDVTLTQRELADLEELLSWCMENQLALVEVARLLRVTVRQTPMELRVDLNRLIDDIEAVEPNIEFVHDRVRLLQQVNNLALNVKQNQIIKVFSIMTAVFLPVMLLSTYYSMNFEFMPGAAWQYGEPAIILASFVFAVLPLLYVRWRGWLR